jgi:hypothetical protein
MALLHLHHHDVGGFARKTAVSLPRVARRIGAAFKMLHRAIVRARLRRLQSELLFRREYSKMLPAEKDVTKFPQRPLILGDKWDF